MLLLAELNTCNTYARFLAITAEIDTNIHFLIKSIEEPKVNFDVELVVQYKTYKYKYKYKCRKHIEFIIIFNVQNLLNWQN